MSNHLVFLLLGLSNGAVFAALALGLVVTYRSSGVINFATGAIALFGAYTYAFLREGRLLILIPGLPGSIDLGGPLGLAPAAAITIALSAGLGLLLYGLVFRPLRSAPAVAKAVASFGVMVVLMQVMAARVGTTPIVVDAIFPSKVYTFGDVRVPGDRLWFAATIIVIAFVLAMAFRFTRFGLATRAAAETEKGAYVSGLSPDRIAALNWMISSAVAAVAGILIAPIVPLIPVAYTLFIVPALAAAILGRFQLIGVAVFAGLAIGMLQSEVAYLKSLYTWLPGSGLPELVPLILVLLVLVARARPLPSRGAVVQRTLPRAPRPHALLLPTLVSAGAAVLALVVMHGSWRLAMLNSLVFGVLGLSLVVVTGYAGQVSLAQLTLAGAAGFLLSPLTTSWDLPFPIAPLLAAGGAMVIGVVVGLPAIRVRGLPLAVVTLALAVALEAFWFRNSDFVPNGGKDIAGPSFLGIDLRVGVGTALPRLEFCFLVLGVLVLVALGVAKLRTSRLGSKMLAVRTNERVAAAAGIDVVRTKVVAFAIGSFIAGLAGTLLGYMQTNVTWDSFSAIEGLTVFATVYLAGITSVSGGILGGLLAAGGIVAIATDRWLALGSWYGAVIGAGLVVTVVLNPEGLVGPWHTLSDRLRAQRAARSRAAEPTPSPAPAGVAAPPAPVRASAPTPEADGTPAPALLSLRDVGVRYGGVVALDSVSFDVAEGSVVGLIGPNGAGKTTLIDAVNGFTRAHGSIVLAGRQLERMKPHQRIHAGLGRTFQAIEIFDDLSIDENVRLGLSATHRFHAGSGSPASSEVVERTLALLGLDDKSERRGGELSQGERQLLSIARALVGQPRLLLLDEPGGGLDVAESEWLAQRLRRIRDDGTTILLVDHDMSLVLNLCDTIHVLDLGVLIASGPPTAIKADRAVAAAYLGTAHSTVVTQPLEVG